MQKWNDVQKRHFTAEQIAESKASAIVDEDEITGDYNVPDLTEHAREARSEKLHGAIVWAAIVVSIIGLAFVIAVSK